MNSNEYTTRQIFDICDRMHRGYIIPRHFATFLQLMTNGKVVPTRRQAEAFIVYQCGKTRFSYESFERWFESPHNFDMVASDKIVLLDKAYTLYHYYTNKDSEMNYKQFIDMIHAEYKTHQMIGIDQVRLLDRNEDGIISFKEFCDWLKWFT